ncbi:hypothetical protein acdb102_00700 [Acidothermaceae bacterium B102]|nr:hypothetical protein acdb102_00700 [Acidothermaceae bacterium B102]
MADAAEPMDAVILAGGRGERMGGLDKPALVVAGSSLLDRVLSACAGCVTVVVVGPDRPTSRPVVFAQESPPGGGPVAALAAGLPHVTAPLVALLAADLPFLTAPVLATLQSSLTTNDGALLVDDTGRDQLLAGVWRTAALRPLLERAGPPQGLALGRLLSALSFVRVTPTELGTYRPEPWRDCDTPEDLRRAEELA